VTISIFNAYFFTVLDEKRAMLLDGYPRSIPQLESFLTLCEKHDRDIVGIYFALSDEEAIARMVNRGRE
jgi:adenylate kinase family enzyme